MALDEVVEFCLGDVVKLAAQLADERADVHDAKPIHETHDVVGDDAAGSAEVFGAGFDVLFDDGGEIVDAVKVDTFEVVDRGVEVAGDGDINDEQRAGATVGEVGSVEEVIVG